MSVPVDVHSAVFCPVNFAVYDAVSWSVRNAVHWLVNDAVFNAMGGGGGATLGEAVYTALREESAP